MFNKVYLGNAPITKIYLERSLIKYGQGGVSVPSDLIFINDNTNKIYAIEKSTLEVKSTAGYNGVVGDILKMDNMLYVADKDSSKIIRYNDKLELQNEAPGTSSISKGLCGVFFEHDIYNYIYNTDASGIQQYAHIDLDRVRTKSDYIGFKHIVQYRNRLYALKQDNSVIVFNASFKIVGECTDRTHADFIIVDGSHLYKYPNSNGTCKKFDISTLVEVATGINTLSLAGGCSLGDYLILVGESRTGIYLVNKTDFSRSKNKYIPSGVGSVDIDSNTNLIYIGSLDGTIHVLDLTTWQYVASRTISSNQITNIAIGKKE